MLAYLDINYRISRRRDRQTDRPGRRTRRLPDHYDDRRRRFVCRFLPREAFGLTAGHPGSLRPVGFIPSLIGAIILLLIYHMIRRRRR